LSTIGRHNPFYALTVSTGAVFLLLASLSQATVGKEDVNSTAARVRVCINSFMAQTFQARIHYRYFGQWFDPNKKEQLRHRAEKAINTLDTLVDQQQKMLEEIEAYQGADWDRLYGVTGLWRKLRANVYVSRLGLCEMRFQRGMAVEESARQDKLKTLLEEVRSLRQSQQSELLAARIMAEIGQNEYKNEALEKLENVIAGETSFSRIYLKAVCEKFRIENKCSGAQLERLVEGLEKSDFANEQELAVLPALLQLKFDNTELSAKTLDICPALEGPLGRLILEDLQQRIEQGNFSGQNAIHPSIIEAELAARTAWKQPGGESRRCLGILTDSPKFHTPLILYAAAVEYAQSDPGKSLRFLIEASRLQEPGDETRPELGAVEIARKAAQFGWQAYKSGKLGPDVVLTAFENYMGKAGENTDEKLQYLYAEILRAVDRQERAGQVLKQIAAEPGLYQDYARLDLIASKIRQGTVGGATEKKQVLPELEEIIHRAPVGQADEKIRCRAIILYCSLLLESPDRSAAKQVLEMISSGEMDSDPGLQLLRAKALYHIDKIGEAIRILKNLSEPANNSYASEIAHLLTQITSRIELLCESVNTEERQNLVEIAEFCYENWPADSRAVAAALLAEIKLTCDWNQKSIKRIKNLIEQARTGSEADIMAVLRCQARFNARTGRLQEAAELWNRICRMQRSRSQSSRQRSWKWWRAKFHELKCLSEHKTEKNKNIRHTIEVLRNSSGPIPPFWAEKLDILSRDLADWGKD